MDVFVVSLPSRTDRRANMAALLRRIGVSRYTFVDPVPPPPLEDIPAEFRAHGVTPGYMSLHLTVRDKVFDMALASSSSSSSPEEGAFLVLEDDVIEMVPAVEVMPSIRAILEDAPPDFDMIYLEYCMERCDGAREGGRKLLRRARAPYCTAAILYNRRAIPKLRACLDDRARLIDMAYVDCVRKGELKAFIASPPLFAQDAAYGAGDLEHMDPSKVQWWLDWVIRMYPSPTMTTTTTMTMTTHATTPSARARLPHCLTFKDVAPYVRWGNVVIVVSAIIIIVSAIVIIFLRALRSS